MQIKPFHRIDPKDWLFQEHPYVANQYRRALENPEANLEEYVRQWALKELVTTYHYPIEWLGARIVIEYEVMVNTVTTNYPDIAILNEKMKPYLFIECKKRGEKLDGPQNANEQLQSSLSVTYTTNVGMATNGDEVRCFLKQIDPKEFVPHFDIPEYKLRDSPKHTQPSKLIKSSEPSKVSHRKTGLLEMDFPTFSRVLFECHSIMRDHNGLHADQALDEMCKLIYTKIFDEISTPLDGDFQFQTWIYSSTEELGSSIRTLYAEARDRELSEMDARIRGYSASRGVFKEDIKLNDSVVEMIVEELQNYSFVDTKMDVRGRAFEKFLKGKIRQAMGEYFTPDSVIRLMVGIIDPNENDLIIDPACGSARFLTKCLEYTRVKHIIPKFGNDSEIEKDFKEKRLHGVEISPMLCRLAMTDMMMHGDGRTNVRCVDGLAAWETYSDIEKGSFSICITNPPFGSKIKDENVLKRFGLGKNKSGRGTRKSQKKEVLFLERCLELLKAGGKLAIIVPEGILENSNDSYIREWYRKIVKVVAVISLPDYTFVPYGANVETSILFLRKWKENEDKNQKYTVFMAKLQDVTYDTVGKDCRCPQCLRYRENPDGKDEIEALISYFHKGVRW